MTEHLHGKGERDRKHRDTGRQRSEPEEGSTPGSQKGRQGGERLNDQQALAP